MDTIKLVYTQLEAFDLVDEYTEAYKKKIKELEEENKKLKEINESQNEEIQRFKDNAMEDMRVQTKLEEENKKLTKCNLNLQEWLDNKEKVNKSLREELSAYDREYFDEDKKAKNIFMEEDTLQELKDIGKL